MDTIEAEAEEILRGAGFEPDDPPDIERLARELVRVVEHRGLSAPARYVAATRELWVNPKLSPRRRTWAIAHELAERHLHAAHYVGDDVERRADALGAALLVPAAALRVAVRGVGRHLDELAGIFSVTQSIVALRLGEVTGSPLALVIDKRVAIRGDPWAWPSTGRLVAIAGGAEAPDGLEVVPVTDARRRAVLRVG